MNRLVIGQSQILIKDNTQGIDLLITFVKYPTYNRLMLIIGVVLVGILSASPHKVVANDLPDTYGNRIVAAERYLQTVSMKDIIHSTIIETAKNVPEDYRSIYVQLMMKYTNVPVIERAALASMVKHFTVNELDALANFYGSALGQSSMKKFGAYMGDLMPVLQQEILKSQDAMMSEFKESVKK